LAFVPLVPADALVVATVMLVNALPVDVDDGYGTD
jgi:hypothetical protein